MTNFVRQLLEDAVKDGWSLIAHYPGSQTADYKGVDTRLCMEALEACDEMSLSIVKRDADGDRVKEWALIINGLAEDEKIADYSGTWIDAWWERTVKPSL